MCITVIYEGVISGIGLFHTRLIFLHSGFQVGHQTSNEQITCLCNHLSAFGGDFFVAPNPIDFDKVFMEFGRLGETGNYVVLSTVCILWALYFLGLIFARKADKKDKDKVGFVVFVIVVVVGDSMTWSDAFFLFEIFVM